MSHGLLLSFEVTILVLAIFLGIEVISKVPSMLHTPLMSGTNAIHGIVIVGAIIGLLVEDGELALDWDDEIVAGACVTRKEAQT